MRKIKKKLPEDVKIECDRAGLERQIDDAGPSRDAARKVLDDANKAQDQWVEQGGSGLKKSGRNIQLFIENFRAFVQAYAGFVDIIRQASGPYGEVAYCTLSVLFTVKKSGPDRRLVF